CRWPVAATARQRCAPTATARRRKSLELFSSWFTRLRRLGACGVEAFDHVQPLDINRQRFTFSRRQLEVADKARVADHLFRSVGRSRVDGLRKRFVDAGEQDQKLCARLLEVLSREAVERAGFINRVDNRPAQWKECYFVAFQV